MSGPERTGGHPSRPEPRPNLFIVGAPKCGTTSMWRYLSGHPDVFMARVKEPNHFGSDVRAGSGLRDRAAYLRLFAAAGGARVVGEASIGYLGSRDAAAEIAAFAPDARIIVMLREPVSHLRSLHAHFLARGIEDIEDLAVALEAGTERFRGRLTGQPTLPELLDYRRAVRHAEQLRRYLAVFPRQHVHVVILEDLARDTPGTFRQMLRFLKVDEGYQPVFERFNPSRRSDRRRFTRWLNAPPQRLRRIARRLVSPTVRRSVWHDRIRTPLFLATSRAEGPPAIDRHLEARLRQELAAEVEALAALIGRPDLPALWGFPAAGGEAVPN